MNQQKNISLKSRKKSFSYAIHGIVALVKREPNAKLHALASIVAVSAGIIRHISHWQWAMLAVAIGLVWITEALNTCIEKLCDFCCDNRIHPAIKIIKDISAAAVLIAAVVSIVVGTIIFIL